MAAARRKPEPRFPKRIPTPDDKWADLARRKVAKAIVAWLKGSVNLQRPIGALSIAELDCMAEAATSAWIVAASERIADEPIAADAEGLTTFLI